MGRDWLQKIKLNMKSIKLASEPDSQTTSPQRDRWQQKVEIILKNAFKDSIYRTDKYL